MAPTGFNGRAFVTDDDIDKTSRLLTDVFGVTRFTPEFLRWLYRESPQGREIESNYDVGEKRLAHYAVIPDTYHRAEDLLPVALSLNTAVSHEVRRKGLFTKLGEETYHKALSTRGIKAVVGVGNRRSTPGLVGKLRFTFLTALPVRMGLALGLRKSTVRSYPVSPDFLHGELFGAIAQRIDYAPKERWSAKWSARKLQWRLESPALRFQLHVHDTGVMISTCDRRWRIPVAIILKFFAFTPGAEVHVPPLLSAACWSHGAPLWLYAGFNECARVGGLAPPRRLLPAPLNLTYRPLCSTAPVPADFVLSTFEFLDFDAY